MLLPCKSIRKDFFRYLCGKKDRHRLLFHTCLNLKRNQIMATFITDECINCGACVPECPNEAISEGDDIHIIDPNRCTECIGFHDYEACQSVCPVECCLPDPNRIESVEDLLARAIALHPDLTLPATVSELPDNLNRFSNPDHQKL